MSESRTTGIFSTRTFFFGQLDYLHDRFKRIDYFVAPAVGFGYKLVEIPSTTFSIDLGGGSVTERNPGSDARTTGGIKAGETLAVGTIRRLGVALPLALLFSGLWHLARTIAWACCFPQPRRV